MIILSKVLHTSRAIEMRDTESKIAAGFEKALGLRAGACKVTLVESAEMTPCKVNEVPHVHYAVTIGYDETNKLDKE